MVTPYQAQVSLISESIREEYPEMTIGSVDGLQGQEREVSWEASRYVNADSRQLFSRWCGPMQSPRWGS